MERFDRYVIDAMFKNPTGLYCERVIADDLVLANRDEHHSTIFSINIEHFVALKMTLKYLFDNLQNIPLKSIVWVYNCITSHQCEHAETIKSTKNTSNNVENTRKYQI